MSLGKHFVICVSLFYVGIVTDQIDGRALWIIFCSMNVVKSTVHVPGACGKTKTQERPVFVLCRLTLIPCLERMRSGTALSTSSFGANDLAAD